MVAVKFARQRRRMPCVKNTPTKKTDEFMPPLIFGYANEQRVRDGDTVLFFNFRADRARQLSQAFLFENFDGFNREVVAARSISLRLTQYDATYPSPFIFGPEELVHILGQVVSAAGKTPVAHCRDRKISARHLFF